MYRQAEFFPAWCRLLALLCLLTLSWAVGAAPTSDLRFQRIAALGADEIPIHSMLQDRQGFAWIGTQSGGLYRYNGYEAVRYTYNPNNPRSLPHDRVAALFEDNKGRIWAGTQNGLARFNPATNDFVRVAPPAVPAKQLIVKYIISDGKNGMWLATWGGVQHFDPDSGVFTLYVHRDADPGSLASNDVNALALDDRGGLWVATWPNGIDYLPAAATVFQHHRVDDAAAPDTKRNNVRALLFDHQRKLWMGTENGVVTWQADTAWEKRRAIPAPATRVHYFFEDRQQRIWAGTLSAGLLRWNKGSDQPVQYVHRANDPHSVPSDHVRAIMQDRGGMLWVASFADGIGLANLDSEGFRRLIPFDAEPGNPPLTNAIRAMDGAPGGRLWIGGNSGAALFDPASGAVLKPYQADATRPGALSSNIVYSLYQQPGGPLWVGTAAGVNRLDRPDGAFRLIRFGNLRADFINTIAPAAHGALWVGTGAAVYHYEPASGTQRAYLHDSAVPDSRSVDGTTTIVADRRGRVWMGSDWNGGGLDLLDVASGRFRHFRHQAGNGASLADDTVSVVYEDARGRLWAGTAKGLNEIVTGPDGAISMRSFAAPGSVGMVKILALRSDAAGMLWISTAAGVMRLDPADGKVARFTASDGLSESLSEAVSYGAPDGALYFGGMKGMTAVHPAAVRTRSSAPQVAITDVSVLNRSLSEGAEAAGIILSGPVTAPTALTLPARHAVFALEFAALHYTDPALSRYAYRLDGFNSDWVETGADHRSATYTNLDPGHYVFEVKAVNRRGVWSEQPARLAITILPPYWHTWWFRLLAAVAIVGLLGSIYQIRVRRLTQRQQQLQALVAARTAELEESNRKLAALSTTDSMTGISNRRGFDSALGSEWRRARRNEHPIALAMLDVDYFKSYNDHYGHQAGDACLRTVAGLIAAHGRRTSDLVARYGGEEFALLASATDADHALLIARGICQALEKLALPHARSPHGVVTVSIGVASVLPHDKNSAEILVRSADLALYRAKKEGRNRACLAAEGNLQPTPVAPAPAARD